MERNEELEKPIYRYAVPVIVERVVLETPLNNTNAIKRIRFETNLGNITHKPKKTKLVTRKDSVFELETQESDIVTTEDLLQMCPCLKELAKDIEEKPRDVILTYVEQSFYNEREQEYETYMFMKPKHFQSLYYENYHKKDKTNLEIQKNLQKKYSEMEL